MSIIYPEQERYLRKLRREPDVLLAEMEKYAGENRVPILNWNAAQLLEQLIRIKKPARALEIGCAIAYSTIRIAMNLEEGAIIDTIELSKDGIKLAKVYIERSGVADKINLFEGNALDIMPKLDKKYDFIFLDADKEDYKALFNLAVSLLNNDAVLFVDNLLWQGYAASDDVPEKYRRSTSMIREFNELFTGHEKLDSVILPVGDGVGIATLRG